MLLLDNKSAGNHAQALAYHGQLLGIPATVVMPTVAPMAKVDKCQVSLILQHTSCEDVAALTAS